MARASKYAEKKDEVLRLIARAQDRHSRPPSVRDLADSVEVGVATMHSYLQRLAEEGMVEWRPRHHRSLRLTPLGSTTLSSLATV